MKRSEMIDKLICRILEKGRAPNEQTAELMAKDYLNVIEEAGMLPPIITKEGLIPNQVKVEEVFNDEVTFGPTYGIYEVNEWEEE